MKELSVLKLNIRVGSAKSLTMKNKTLRWF